MIAEVILSYFFCVNFTSTFQSCSAWRLEVFIGMVYLVDIDSGGALHLF